MKKIITMVALSVCATLGMKAMPIAATVDTQTEISTRINYVQMGTINASMNAGESELKVLHPSEQVIGLMPGPMIWYEYGSYIIITNVDQFFDTSTPGTSFTFELGVSINSTTTGIYKVIVTVK